MEPQTGVTEIRVLSPQYTEIQPALCSDVESLQRFVRTQQQTITELTGKLIKSQNRVEQLESEIKELKKLKGKPKIRASRLNIPKTRSKNQRKIKRAGSTKTSKKESFESQSMFALVLAVKI